MRFILAAILTATVLTDAAARDFNLYPGFRNPDAIVEMTSDKGLVVEIVLRCERKANGHVKAGIMTYSKIERLYCSSKNRCFQLAEAAFEDTCY